MFTNQSISSDLVLELDEQLNRISLGVVAHVASDRANTPALVAIGVGLARPHPLNHPVLESFVEAELIAARVNALLGAGDSQRIAILRYMANAGGN